MRALNLCHSIIMSGLKERDKRFFENDDLVFLYCGLLTFSQKHDILQHLNSGHYRFLTKKGEEVLRKALA